MEESSRGEDDEDRKEFDGGSSVKLPLAAVVAGAVAISCTIPSRRIAQFLMSLMGHTIPDEEGNHWQARLEGPDVVRLEKNPGDGSRYEEFRLPLSAWDEISFGDEPEAMKAVEPVTPLWAEGLEINKAFLLAGFVGAYREKLVAAGIWTDADDADLGQWIETLTPEEKEGLFPLSSPEEEPEEKEADASP